VTTGREPTERFSLKRWSRRKLESTAKAPGAVSTEPSTEARRIRRDLPEGSHAPTDGRGSGKSSLTLLTPAAGAPLPVESPPTELPPIESLTFDSDFTAFLRPEVEPTLQRAALKQLFRDPRFNVMDGLDTYIDDYTKPDPIPPDMLAELVKRFDFTPTPPPAAPAAAKGVPPESPSHAAAPVAERPTSELGGVERVPTAAGAISTATAQPAGGSATTAPAATPVPTETARESTVARDERR
jgi:uncharacterized protein DUF3306